MHFGMTGQTNVEWYIYIFIRLESCAIRWSSGLSHFSLYSRAPKPTVWKWVCAANAERQYLPAGSLRPWLLSHLFEWNFDMICGCDFHTTSRHSYYYIANVCLEVVRAFVWPRPQHCVVGTVPTYYDYWLVNDKEKSWMVYVCVIAP